MNRKAIEKSNRRFARAQRIKKIRNQLEKDGCFHQLRGYNYHGITSVQITYS